MSVKAYIIRNVEINMDDEHIIFKKILDNEPLFNLWRNSRIFEMFMEYGCDFSNNDSIGEIMISRCDWMDFKRDFKNEGWSKEDLDILNKINDELKVKEDIWCECF